MAFASPAPPPDRVGTAVAAGRSPATSPSCSEPASRGKSSPRPRPGSPISSPPRSSGVRGDRCPPGRLGHALRGDPTADRARAACPANRQARARRLAPVGARSVVLRRGPVRTRQRAREPADRRAKEWPASTRARAREGPAPCQTPVFMPGSRRPEVTETAAERSRAASTEYRRPRGGSGLGPITRVRPVVSGSCRPRALPAATGSCAARRPSFRRPSAGSRARSASPCRGRQTTR
jgi:hypothetical protein